MDTWLLKKQDRFEDELTIGIVAEIFLDKTEGEKYYTARVTLLDDSENPTTLDKVPIETALIPNIKQKVELSKRDGEGSEIPYAITGIILDNVFRAPFKEDFFAGAESLSDFAPGDQIYFSESSAIIIRKNGKIQIINQESIQEFDTKSITIRAKDVLELEANQIKLGKDADVPAVIGSQLESAWADSVDSNIQALISFAKKGIAPGPAGGIIPLSPSAAHTNFDSSKILSDKVKIEENPE